VRIRLLQPSRPLSLCHLGLLGLCLLGAPLGAQEDSPASGAIQALRTGDCAGALRQDTGLQGALADAEDHYAWALCLQRQKRLGEALDSVDQALALRPGFEEAQRLQRALQAELQDGACRALCQSADLDRSLGRLDQAERGYRLALSLDPGCIAAQAGLAAMGWPRGALADVWQDTARANPGTSQAQGLRSLLATARGVDAGAAQYATVPDNPDLWSGFVRGGLQQSDRAAPAGDQDGVDALLFGRLERRATTWAAAYAYFLDFNRSSTGTARVDYHSLNLSWTPGAPAWSLQFEEAMEWSQGQPAYGHHLAEFRRDGAALGAWRTWTSLQALWENYAAIAELDAFAPSLAEGLEGPLVGGGHVGLEIRLRTDDTQTWADRDAGAGCHMILLWRAGKSLSPRLDLDFKVQEFPDWPGGPGRFDQSLDGRFELTLWQDRPCQVSASDEAWNHASSVGDYSEIGNSVFLAGTIYW
jgi:hypothetical protein